MGACRRNLHGSPRATAVGSAGCMVQCSWHDAYGSACERCWWECPPYVVCQGAGQHRRAVYAVQRALVARGTHVADGVDYGIALLEPPELVAANSEARLRSPCRAGPHQ